MSMTKTQLRGVVAAAIAAGISLAGARAQAGLTMVFQRGTSTPSTMWIEGANMRVDSSQAPAQATGILIDGAAKRMVVLNDGEKSYMVITAEDMKRMKDGMKAMRAQAQAHLKDMPPEQRKRMEAMLGQMGGDQKPHDYKFEKMGAKKTINGFACEMYRLKVDGKAHEEDCIAPWGPAVVQKADFATLKPFFDEMAKDFSGAAGAGGNGGDLFERINKAPGFPVSRVPLDENGKPGEEEQLKSVKRGAIPADKFAIPTAYTKKSLPMMAPPAPGAPGGPPKAGPFRPLPPQK